jgi:hypothetical protein
MLHSLQVDSLNRITRFSKIHTIDLITFLALSKAQRVARAATFCYKAGAIFLLASCVGEYTRQPIRPLVRFGRGLGTLYRHSQQIPKDES